MTAATAIGYIRVSMALQATREESERRQLEGKTSGACCTGHDKIMQMAALTFYADESGPDSDSEFAVVGGLLLHPRDFFWLDVKWKNALARHAITLPIHMREFGAHGAFRGLEGFRRMNARACLPTSLPSSMNINTQVLPPRS
jgi:hypothetical protein